MTTCLAVFFLAFVLSLILTNAVRLVASVLGIVDKPDGFRKIHTRAVPRLGGISIFLAFFVPLGFLYWGYRNPVSDLLLVRPVELTGLFAGSLVALAMGLADDFFNLAPRWKLLLQVIAGSLAWAAGLSIAVISNPFGPPLQLGIFSFPVTVFWFVACMNAVNLMDGLDGLAAGICLFVVVTLFLVSLLFKNVLGMLFMSCVSGAILGFLIFNFYPAKIFLGDSGSMLLGFLIASLSLVGSTRKAETAIALIIPVIALGLPILDTSISILRRWYKRLPISSPDRQHIHHKLLSMGYSQRRAVLLMYSASVFLGGAALLITVGRSELSILVLGSLFIIAFVSVRVLGGLRVGDVFFRLSQDQARRRSSAIARVAVERAVVRMQRAASVGGVWEVCTDALRDMDIDHALLRVIRANGSAETMSWFNEGCERAVEAAEIGDVWSCILDLRGEDARFGRLEFGKDISGEPPMPDVAALADILRQAIVFNLARILSGNDPWTERPDEAGETIQDMPSPGMQDNRPRA